MGGLCNTCKNESMTEPIYRLRSTSQFVKAIFLVLFFGIFMVATYIDPNSAGIHGPIIVLVGGLLITYVFFYQPALLLDRDGITAINWFTNRSVSWKDFQELDTRLGMHIVSSAHSDIVSSYPGSGGLSRGRQALPVGSRFGKSKESQSYIRLVDSGQHQHRASMKEASSLVRRMADECTRTAPNRPRTKSVDPIRIGLVVIGAALIYFGMISSIPSS